MKKDRTESFLLIRLGEKKFKKVIIKPDGNVIKFS